MIIARNAEGATRTQVGNGSLVFSSDTTPPKGRGEGFRPHEVLEAALASCMAITLRLAAQERDIPVDDIEVRVNIERAEDSSTFQAAIELTGNLTERDRTLLMAAAHLCPVRKTLSKRLTFVERQA